MNADLIERLRDGLEVATKGEWAVDGYNTAAVIFRQHGKTHVTDWMRLARCDEDNANWKADAAHIANCSPDNIRILLDALAAKDTALSEMRAELERARKALATADEAISEYIRYLDGGEMRGSYDGKPERVQLRKAGYAVRAARALASKAGAA